MRKRTYAKPVLARLGDLYQLTLARTIDEKAEFFDQSLSSPNY